MRKPQTANLLGAVGIAAFLLLVPLPFGTEQTWVDPVSGSYRTSRSYLGIPMRSQMRRSALEEWIIKHEESYTPTWQSLSRASFTISGGFCAVGCREAPPIYFIANQGDGELLRRFIEQASDAEVVAFVRVMRTGTQAEQEAAVKAIAARG